MNHIQAELLKIDELLSNHVIHDNDVDIINELIKENLNQTSHLKSSLEYLANLIYLSDSDYVNKKIQIKYKPTGTFFDKNIDWFLSECLNRNESVVELGLRERVYLELQSNVKIESLIKFERMPNELAESIISYTINNSLGMSKSDIDGIYAFYLKELISEDSMAKFLNQRCHEWSILENFKIEVNDLMMASDLDVQTISVVFKNFCDELENEYGTNEQLERDFYDYVNPSQKLIETMFLIVQEYQNVNQHDIDKKVGDLVLNVSKILSEKSIKDKELAEKAKIEGLERFSEYVKEDVENFIRHKDNFEMLYLDLMGKDSKSIELAISVFVNRTLMKNLLEKFNEFTDKKLKIVSGGNNAFEKDATGYRLIYKTMSEDVKRVVNQYVVIELIKQYQINVSEKKVEIHFKDQRDFFENQKFYLKKVCEELSVDENMIDLKYSKIKIDQYKTISGIFSGGFASASPINGKYSIVLNRLSEYVNANSEISLERMVQILFHEVTHIKQYIDKKLRYENGRAYWLGIDYSDQQRKAEIDYNAYLQLPWEIEARENEKRAKNLLEKYPEKIIDEKFIDKIKKIFT